MARKTAPRDLLPWSNLPAVYTDLAITTDLIVGFPGETRLSSRKVWIMSAASALPAVMCSITRFALAPPLPACLVRFLPVSGKSAAPECELYY